MTFKTYKTILFASLIATMILPFSMIDVAQAEQLTDSELLKLAKKAARIIEKIENSEKPRQIERLKAKLDPIMVTLNAHGMYTETQFEDQKIERLTPPTEPEQAAFSAACGCGDPTVYFRAGFDWRLYGYIFGSTLGPWKSLDTPDTSDISKASTASWGADYMHVFSQAYIKDASSASLVINTTIKNSNDGLVKTYSEHTETITGTSSDLDEFYESSIAYSPINGGDNARVLGYLQSIT